MSTYSEASAKKPGTMSTLPLLVLTCSGLCNFPSARQPWYLRTVSNYGRYRVYTVTAVCTEYRKAPWMESVKGVPDSHTLHRIAAALHVWKIQALQSPRQSSDAFLKSELFVLEALEDEVYMLLTVAMVVSQK